MNDLSRSLKIYADNALVPGVGHARLTGRDAIGLSPTFFTLRLWNLEDAGYYMLLAAKTIQVQHNDSALADGAVADVFRTAVDEGTVTEVVFSAALRLWESPVCFSVTAGTKVSEAVRQILVKSGTGVSLLSFPGSNPSVARGQAFFGRAAECIETALSPAGARCCLSPAGLCIIPSSALPVSMVLSEEDLIDAPVETVNHGAILRTNVIGWLIGKRIRVAWKGKTLEGLVTERNLDADNNDGNWECMLYLSEVV